MLASNSNGGQATTEPRPCDTAKALHAYFRALIAYAKHILERRPGEVVSMKSLSSSGWRKEHWETLIRDGRARGVPGLPNPELIDAWFEQFRAYKRNIGVKDVSVAQEYPKRGSLPDFDAGFGQAVRAHKRALTEMDEEEDLSPDEEDDVDDEIYVIEPRPRRNEGPATRSRTRQSDAQAGSSTGARSEPVAETINSRLSSMRVQQQPDQN
ncbi:hypothetical protein GGF32_008642, partial [Allomyces javanicus]